MRPVSASVMGWLLGTDYCVRNLGSKLIMSIIPHVPGVRRYALRDRFLDKSSDPVNWFATMYRNDSGSITMLVLTDHAIEPTTLTTYRFGIFGYGGLFASGYCIPPGVVSYAYDLLDTYDSASMFPDWVEVR